MAKFLPKSVPDEKWQPLVQQRDFAMLCGAQDTVHFRFGAGHGMYISIAPSASGRVVNGIDFETGEATLLGKLPDGFKAVIGRTSDCSIKVMHAIISRQHLELTHSGNILTVQDLGSTNGTFFIGETKHFDIADYIENHPIKDAAESTLDALHEAFGPGLDDFLKNYSQSKGNQ